MYLESTLYIKISKLINRNRRKNQLSIFYVQLAVKNALSIINFNSSPVNIKKTWCTVIDFVRIWNQFLFSINHTFYRLQSGWNKCKCLANKKAQSWTDTISHGKKTSKIQRQQCYSMFFWCYYFGVWSLSKCNKCYDIS